MTKHNKPQNDLRFVYSALMDIDAFYDLHKDQYEDPIIFLCHLVGCKINDIKELTLKNLGKIDALQMRLTTLNKDKQILSIDEMSDIKNKLEEIKLLLSKTVNGLFNADKLYDGVGNSIITSLELLISMCSEKSLGGDFFDGLWSYNPIVVKPEFTDGVDMEEDRIIITNTVNDKITFIKNIEPLTPQRPVQILSEKYSDNDVYLSDNRKIKSAYREIKRLIKKGLVPDVTSIDWSYIHLVPKDEFNKMSRKKISDKIKLGKYRDSHCYYVSANV